MGGGKKTQQKLNENRGLIFNIVFFLDTHKSLNKTRAYCYYCLTIAKLYTKMCL